MNRWPRIWAAVLWSAWPAVTAVAEHPSGWTVGGDGYEVVLDRDDKLVGAGSLRITRDGDGSAGFAMRRIAADGEFVRLSAAIRAEGVTGGYAGLFVRFDSGEDILYLDNMRDRGVAGTVDWTRHAVIARVPQGADWLVYGALLTGTGTAWFDAFHVESLAAEQVPDAPPQALAYLDRALNLIEQHALYAQRVDWAAVRAELFEAARGRATTADTHALVRDALRRLGDRHSQLMPPREAEAWRAGDMPSARRVPSGRMVAARIALIELPPFDGDDEHARTAYANEGQSLIRTQAEAGACAWIVDLRGNHGGNMWPMLAAVGPLLGADEVGAFEAANGDAARWWYRQGAAGAGDRTASRVTVPPVRLNRVPPVAVLTGPTTASSGEAMAVAFRGRPDARSFGAPTAGIPTGNQLFELSDGAMLWLTTSRFADRTGPRYESALEPDEPLIPQGRVRSADPVLDAATAWLRARCAAAR